jgi:hypothetical protein
MIVNFGNKAKLEQGKLSINKRRFPQFMATRIQMPAGACMKNRFSRPRSFWKSALAISTLSRSLTCLVFSSTQTAILLTLPENQQWPGYF